LFRYLAEANPERSEAAPLQWRILLFFEFRAAQALVFCFYFFFFLSSSRKVPQCRNVPFFLNDSQTPLTPLSENPPLRKLENSALPLEGDRFFFDPDRHRGAFFETIIPCRAGTVLTFLFFISFSFFLLRKRGFAFLFPLDAEAGCSCAALFPVS